jgi:predicted TIM-barrel fold metal-dependent hydrolase
MAADGRSITGVDTHAHIFERGLEFAAQRRYAPNYDATVDLFLAKLDANGLSHGVLVQPSFLGTNNDYLLAGIAKSAGRLKGIVVVAPPVTEDQLDTFAAGGAVGIRLNLVEREIPDLAGPDWKQLLGSVARRGWQVEVHVEAKRLAETLPPLLDGQVNVVVDHFGRPDPKLGTKDPGFEYLLSLGPSRRVWVKLSAPYRLSDQIAQEAIPLARAALGQRLAAHTAREGHRLRRDESSARQLASRACGPRNRARRQPGQSLRVHVIVRAVIRSNRALERRVCRPSSTPLILASGRGPKSY